VVDGIVAGEDQLGDGYKGIALLSELSQDGGRGLGGVEGRVSPFCGGSSASKSLVVFWFSFATKREHPSVTTSYPAAL